MPQFSSRLVSLSAPMEASGKAQSARAKNVATAFFINFLLARQHHYKKFLLAEANSEAGMRKEEAGGWKLEMRRGSASGRMAREAL
jgi:hypothetical protein